MSKCTFRIRNINKDFNNIQNNYPSVLSTPKEKKNKNHFESNSTIFNNPQRTKLNELSKTQTFFIRSQSAKNVNKINSKKDNSPIQLIIKPKTTIQKNFNNGKSFSILRNKLSKSNLDFYPRFSRSNRNLNLSQNNLKYSKRKYNFLNQIKFHKPFSIFRTINNIPLNKRNKIQITTSLCQNSTITNIHTSNQKKSFILYNSLQDKINKILDSSTSQDTINSFSSPKITKEYFDKQLRVFQPQNIQIHEIVNDIIGTKKEKEEYIQLKNESELSKQSRLKILSNQSNFYSKLNPEIAYKHRYHFANKNGFNWDIKYQYKKKDRNKLKKQSSISINTYSKYKRKVFIHKPDDLLI